MGGRGAAGTGFRGFGERALDFYEGLTADNSRTYWQEHRAVYEEHVRDPLRALAAALEPEFGEPKVFRPHRDVRFSPDKRPYKETASMAVEHAGGSLYLSLSADGLLLAGGWYEPARDQLARFRTLQDDPVVAAELDRTLEGLAARGFPLGGGDPLRTAPRGWPRDHPRIELLRLRRLTVSAHHEPEPWLLGPECRGRVVDAWRTVATWNAWLDRRVGATREPSRRG